MYVYEGTFWKLVNHNQGQWILYEYAAGNFTASAGNWTVDDVDETIYYRLVCNELQMRFQVATTDVSATPQNLFITLPNGYTSQLSSIGFEVCRVRNNGGTWVPGMCSATGTTLAFWSDLTGTGWSTTSSDNTDVFGHATIVVT